MTVRIVIADNHTLFRQALARLLAPQADIEVVGEAEDGMIAVQQVEEMRPDVVLMDVAMPGLNGIEATRRIVSQMPAVRVLGLSAHLDARYARGMLKAGARGYVLKTATPEELVQAIDRVATGGTYLDHDVTDLVVADYVRQQSSADGRHPGSLTSRERDVLRMLANGRTTKEMALELKLSVKTVETYRTRIMEKLELRTVAELTKYAIREGLTLLDS